MDNRGYCLAKRKWLSGHDYQKCLECAGVYDKHTHSYSIDYHSKCKTQIKLNEDNTLAKEYTLEDVQKIGQKDTKKLLIEQRAKKLKRVLK